MKSILVIRLSAIGDIVMASPVIHALRRKHPQAHIAWLVQPEGRDLLKDHPELDEVIVWPRSEWRRLLKERRYLALWRQLREFRKGLRQRRFDLVIDLQGLFKSGLLAWLSGARQRIGLGSREGSQHLMSRVIDRQGGRPELIGSEYRHLAEQLALPVDDFAMQVGIGGQAEASVGKIQREQLGGRDYAVICPFTTRPQKHWFEDAWIELVARMRTEFGLDVVMLGGPADVEAARAIAAAADVRDLVGKTGLQEAAAIIRDSALLVGVDTGLTHMGIAFERPTVCLFGSTRPYLDTGSERARVIYHALSCSPCRRRPTCAGRFDCMREITPAEVIEVARPLLEERV